MKVCDLFLFDTKCEQYGGSGNLFDWNILHTYNGLLLTLLAEASTLTAPTH